MCIKPAADLSPASLIPVVEMFEAVRGSTHWSTDRLQQILLSRGDCSAAWVEGGKVYGFCLLHLLALNPLLIPQPTLVLRRLVVLELRQRSGIGTSLWHHAVRRALSTVAVHGARHMAWQTNTANQQANAYFAARGFQPRGLFVLGGRSDSIYLEEIDIVEKRLRE